MIVSFRSKDAARLNAGKRVPEFQAIERIVLRKLRQLQIAQSIDDLRMPPGNRLEALHGDREGQYSIRVNDRYRICFIWSEAGPCEVEIVDYHK